MQTNPMFRKLLTVLVDSAAFLTCAALVFLQTTITKVSGDFPMFLLARKPTWTFGDGATYYECYQVEYGHNTGEKMLDGNGNIMSYSNYSSGTVICYTCLDHWTNIYITY